MSNQMQSYRWTDKPVHFKQAFLLIALLLVIAVLVIRLRNRFKAQTQVLAFTHAQEDRSRNQTLREMEKQGVRFASNSEHTSLGRSRGGSSDSRASSQKTIQERPLFDGATATLAAVVDRSVSSASGESSLDATVVALIPDGTISSGNSDTFRGSKLSGQFQPNFDTQRLLTQFRELTTPDGRHYSVVGIAMDEEEKSTGIPASYSSGVGLRVLGATLGTAINTAEVLATSRVLQNDSGQDAFISRQLNQAASDSVQRATSSISDEATRDLKNQKAVLSVPAGSRFRVKLRAISTTQGGT